MRTSSTILFIGILCALFYVTTSAPSAFAEPSLGSGGGITNPLGGGPDQSITDVLKKVINWMLGLVGFLALIALIIGGARMIIDFGNEDQVKKAKATILWAVVGLAVVILSYAIINIVTSEILGTKGPSAQEKYEGNTGP